LFAGNAALSENFRKKEGEQFRSPSFSGGVLEEVLHVQCNSA
jgi:hypothetical protein